MTAPEEFQCNLRRRYSLLLAAAAMALVVIWTSARIHFVFGGNWTAVFCHGTMFPMPPELEPGTLHSDGSGYDGQFYRLLAHDPFLQKGYARYADAPQLRFRRVLVPFLAWLLAFGQTPWIDISFFLVEIIFIGLGVYWTAQLFVRRGGSPAWGIVFLILPATLASFDRMLLDGPLTALFAGFLLYAEEERWGVVWVIAMLAALTRETGFLLMGGLAGNALVHYKWRQTLWFSACAMPAAAWYLWLSIELPADQPFSLLAFPGWGVIQRLFLFRPYPDPIVRVLIVTTDALAAFGLLMALCMAIRWLLQSEVSCATFCAGLFTLMGLSLGTPYYMAEAFGYGRPISPLLLWLVLEGFWRREGIGLIATVMISMSVSLAFLSPAYNVARKILGM